MNNALSPLLALGLSSIVSAAPAPAEFGQRLEALLEDSIRYNVQALDLLQGTAQDEDPLTNSEINARLDGERQRIVNNTQNFVNELISCKINPASLPDYRGMMGRYRRANLVLLDQIDNQLSNDGRDTAESGSKLFLFKQSYVNEKLRHEDTRACLLELTERMRRLLGNLQTCLSGIKDAASAAKANEEITRISLEYEQIFMEGRLYFQDDPEGAQSTLGEMKAVYEKSCSAIIKEVERLRREDCYQDEALQNSVQMLSHLAPEEQ